MSRYVAPILAGIGSPYIIWGALRKDMFLHFGFMTLVIVGVGLPFMKRSMK